MFVFEDEDREGGMGADEMDEHAPVSNQLPGSASEDDVCPICHETFGDVRTTLQRSYRVTPCGHVFCAPCLERWLSGSRKCPSCMSEVAPRLEQQQQDDDAQSAQIARMLMSLLHGSARS